MELNYIVCPECRAQLEPERIRCSRCSAFVYDTNPWRNDHNIVIIPVALVLTILAILIIHYAIDSYLSTVFGDGISMTILGFGIYSILLVQAKARVTRLQQRAFRIVREVCAESDEINDYTLREIRHRITDERLGSYNTLLAYNRMQWIVQAAQAPRTHRESQLAGLREHGATDWDAQESAFAPVQYLVWLLPSMGFLGTVFGMTSALSKFSDAVSRQASELAFKDALSRTAQGLGIAFHTTLVGLAAVIPVLWLATGIRRRTQQFLEQLDKFFVRLSMDVLERPDPQVVDTDQDGEADEQAEVEFVTSDDAEMIEMTTPVAASEDVFNEAATPDESAETMREPGEDRGNGDLHAPPPVSHEAEETQPESHW